ncbi:hypothetical protein BJV78DRAFT_1230633 [Lactifluus subvellereus]|nr:hypothetical protein BJV78DRAFT_1230633 [Lactifluus subvellereus]
MSTDVLAIPSVQLCLRRCPVSFKPGTRMSGLYLTTHPVPLCHSLLKVGRSSWCRCRRDIQSRVELMESWHLSTKFMLPLPTTKRNYQCRKVFLRSGDYKIAKRGVGVLCSTWSASDVSLCSWAYFNDIPSLKTSWNGQDRGIVAISYTVLYCT